MSETRLNPLSSSLDQRQMIEESTMSDHLCREQPKCRVGTCAQASLAFNEATHSHDIIDQMSKFTAWKHELDTNPHIFSRKDWQTLAISRELAENVSVTVFPHAY
eukprot:3932847-Rhodomonas_salina.5